MQNNLEEWPYLYNPIPGSIIEDVITLVRAERIKGNKRAVGFVFNGVIIRVDNSKTIEQLVADYLKH